MVGTQTSVQYWIQVGGCDQCALQGGGVTEDEGNISLSLDAPPANDQRSGARPVALGATVENFTFGALSDVGESLTCGPVPYDKTVWYRFATTATGAVTVAGSGFRQVVSRVPRATGRRWAARPARARPPR